jgi:capsular exopolysaccharide synthesis family protein
MNDITFPRPPGQPLPSLGGADASNAEVTAVPLVEQYLRIAIRWKWLIAASVAVALTLGILATLLATPLYTATTRLEISREGSRIVNVGEVEPDTKGIDMEFYQTQYGLLQSKSLAERVARQLKLTDDKAFFTTFGREDLFEKDGTSLATQRSKRMQVATEILLKRIDVAPIRLSRLVDVSWTSPNPQLSARVANEWASSFVQSSLERRYDATAYARQFLENRLEQLRKKLEDSERKLVGFASDQAIINIPVGPTDGKGAQVERSLTADTLAALNEQLAEATADRIRTQSRLNHGDATAEAIASPALATMRQQRADAAAEYANMLAQFEPGYPAAKALAAKVSELDRNIAREEARVNASLTNAYRDAATREQQLGAKVQGLKDQFLDQRRRSIQYNIYQRDVDTNRELYDGLLQRYKEIGVGAGVGTNNIVVVDPADVPDHPSHPRPLINLLLALLAGLIAGIGLALVREQMDETISDPAELERRVGLPLLGAIPSTEDSDPREELKDPKSGLTEAYLSVQSSLAFSSDHGIPQTLAVTSTRASEGKSTSAYAIAHSIARGGARAILVDGDMRSPSVHGNLGLPNDKGLSNYLSGTDNLDALIQHPEAERLAVLTAGPPPPNAAELLRSPRLAALLAELRERFDHVIIDSPPVLGIADAPTIGSAVEGTIYVIEAKAVKARMVTRALNRLRQSRAPILGTVLTKFNPKKAHLGYGYEYGYGYGHDNVYGSQKTKRA